MSKNAHVTIVKEGLVLKAHEMVAEQSCWLSPLEVAWWRMPVGPYGTARSVTNQATLLCD